MSKKLLSKKITAIVSAIAVAVPVLVIPGIASAAVTEVNRNYDEAKNSSIIVSPWNQPSHRYIKSGNAILTAERIDGSGSDVVYPDKGSITIEPNPISKDNKDMVVRIAKDSTWAFNNFAINHFNQNATNQYFPLSGNRTVTSFNFMLGGDPVTDIKFYIQSNGTAKSTDLVKIAYNSETDEHTMSFRTATGWNSASIEQNKWYSFTIVADFTDEDPAAKYMFLYLNGEEMSSIEGGEDGANFAAINLDVDKIFGLIAFTGKTTGTESVFYYDDYRVYEPTGENATISITSLEADSIYMGGSEIKLEAKTYMSTSLEMIEKVEYYDGETKVAESGVAPYKCYYVPETPGKHTITAKMYLKDVRNPIVSAPVSVWSDQTFKENVLVSVPDFDGTFPGPGTWRASEPVSVELDEVHNKSIKIGGSSGRWINYILPQAIISGYVKVSGEYYVNEHIISDDGEGNLTTTANNVNNTLIAEMIGTGAGNVQTSQISGTTFRTYVNKMQNPTNLQSLAYDRWYKIDVITKVKPEGQGYLDIYVDGKKLYNQAFPELCTNGNVSEANATGLKAIDKIGNISFAQLFNTGILTLDNLKISTLDMDYVPVFTSGDNEITAVSEIVNGEVSASVVCQDNSECKLIMAVYNGNVLENIKIGSIDSTGRKAIVSFASEDSIDFTGKTVKVMVWDDCISPIGEMKELQ